MNYYFLWVFSPSKWLFSLTNYAFEWHLNRPRATKNNFPAFGEANFTRGHNPRVGNCEKHGTQSRMSFSTPNFSINKWHEKVMKREHNFLLPQWRIKKKQRNAATTKQNHKEIVKKSCAKNANVHEKLSRILYARLSTIRTLTFTSRWSCRGVAAAWRELFRSLLCVYTRTHKINW